MKALKLPSSLASPFEPELLWESSGTRDQRMASALYHEGLLFAGGRRGIFEVIDAKNGDVLYRKRLEIGELFSSPTMAGGLIFFGSRDGKMMVIEPGREFKEVATNETERISTVPLFSEQRMYLRTDRRLYCIGR